MKLRLEINIFWFCRTN